MSGEASPGVPMWKQCENVFETWLIEQGYTVTRLSTLEGNTRGTNAPMITVDGKPVRAPDIQTAHGSRSEYWEIKFRSRTYMDPTIGRAEHRVERIVFEDYRTLNEKQHAPVWLVVHEAATATSAARWLRISTTDAFARGRRAMCPGSDGTLVDSWLWPVDAMELLQGPPVVPFVGPSVRSAACQPVTLDSLCGQLGLPTTPRYSVMLVGGEEEQVSGALKFLEYGIRVFLVASKELSIDQQSETAPFRDPKVRMLEFATHDASARQVHWIVDGQMPCPMPEWLNKVLDDVDTAAHINLKQYRVVHAPAGSNIIVRAGAGTGKTETMAERLVFLLSTASEHLSLDQIVLTTFTREAAGEMRRRLARTFMLRQRLCPKCVQPAAAWLMQLCRAQVSTLHVFAQQLIRRYGAVISVGPTFDTSVRTMALRECMANALAAHVAPLYARFEGGVPPFHNWVQHLTAVWEVLENSGLPPAQLGDGDALQNLDWGNVEGDHDDLPRAINRAVRDVITAVAPIFAEECRTEQSLRLGMLVREALRALPDPAHGAHSGRVRYMFVDEFQDSDATQIDLVLKVSQSLDARLFVVGDIKQGVYRFRGAQGQAFERLVQRMDDMGLQRATQFPLTHNFRSGSILLDSLHPKFTAWGRVQPALLDYGEEDRLVPCPSMLDRGTPLTLVVANGYESCLRDAATRAVELQQKDPRARIALLCRTNPNARDVQRRVRDDHNTPCDLLVGGDFYRTEAVREARVLLEAMLSPDVDAALLELCETRWVAALLGEHADVSRGLEDADGVWQGNLEAPVAWAGRVPTTEDPAYPREDLSQLRLRVRSVAGMLRRMSAMAFMAECARRLRPAQCERADDNEQDRRAYERNLDHLITLLDEQFAEAPATADTILDWIRLQIATNDTEDEPRGAMTDGPEAHEGGIVAITVHKSKGLEFDHVVIPWTRRKFSARGGRSTSGRVLMRNAHAAAGGEVPHLRWEWKPDPRAYPLTNSVPQGGQDNAEAQLDQVEATETSNEEARLLYVALTRARASVTAYMGKEPTDEPSWDTLLRMGGAQ